MTPIGSIVYWPSQLMPTGYLLCDGREVAINDYPELYTAIGNIGGDDVASGNFRLPDMRGVVAGGYHAGLPSSNPLHGNFGDQVGAPTHTLTIDEMPKHGHTATNFIYNSNKNPFNINTNGNATLSTAEGHVSVDTEGGNQPHSIVQPTKLYNWVIKAKHVTQLGGTVSNDFEVKGKLIMPEDKWASSGGAIDMRNSDIVNANSIWMNDEADSASEGILFLKQGATPGSNSYTDYECLRGYRGKLYYNENPVVESGSNSNGRWTKWMDGTMICYKHIDFGSVVITTAWGSFYETASDYSCGNYPQAFVETPCISIMPINTCFVEKRGNTTATSWGSFWACRPAQYESFSLVVDCIAIGRWK